MQAASVVFEQVVMLVLFAGIGYALCKTKLADSKFSKLLSTLEIYVFLPANFIKTYSNQFTVSYCKNGYPIILASLAILVVVIAIAGVLSRLLAPKGYLRAVYNYSLVVPNYGYMGYALAGAVFGELVLQNVMLFALPLTIYIYTVGYNSLIKSGKMSLKKLLNPVLISIAIGAVLGLTGIGKKLPTVVTEVVNKSAACMSPISMILAGMVLAEFKFSTLLKRPSNYAVTVLRLVVLPIAIAGVLKLLGLGLEQIIIPSLMIYAMPCGMNTIVFPRLVGEDCEPGAALALISTVACCVTLPLCVLLFA